MDRYRIFFGGTYTEHWTDQYEMSVTYSERKSVTAELMGGKWTAVVGDSELVSLLNGKDCPNLLRLYFSAAAWAEHSVRDCIRRGLPLERIFEICNDSINPLAAPELIRLLMDEHGMKLEDACRTVLRCCTDIRSTGIDPAALIPLQPRTAHVISVLRDTVFDLPAAEHDGRKPRYRFPCGAVECEEDITLSFRVLSGNIDSADLIIYSDSFRRELPMERHGNFFTLRSCTPDLPMAMWYCFRLNVGGKPYWLCPDETGYDGKLFTEEQPGFRLTVYMRHFDTPAWFRKSIMYQVFPDRFAFSDDDTAEQGIAYHMALGQTPELHASTNEPVRWQPRPFEKEYSPDDFYGGTLRGIIGKLDYLKELGISCLYLNPIVEARSNHRYDTSDYLKVDPILGTNEDFELLCREAESRDIRVVLDGVFSHTGADSRYFNKYGNYPGVGACQGEQSDYYGWFDFRSFPDDYRCWWGFKDLPEVDELNPRWQDFVILSKDSVVKTWLRRGAAGWRLDVADELPDEALELIRSSAKEEKPDALILGEVWEDAVIKESCGGRRRYALGLSLDSVMNYPFRTALLDFAHGRIDAYGLRDFLTAQQMNYPKPMYYSLMNLLGSHDVPRIRNSLAVSTDLRTLSREAQLETEFSNEAMETALETEKLLAAVQFAVPGVPSIYYGDEQGLRGVGDPFNRGVFREENSALHDHYAYLARLRASSPALSTGNAVFSAASADILLILRYITDGRDVFGDEAENGVYLAVINRGSEADFTADCCAAGAGIYSGRAKARSAEIINLR